MPKRSSKSDDPIISAKRVLDQVVAKHDLEAATKAKAIKPQKQTGKRLQKRKK